MRYLLIILALLSSPTSPPQTLQQKLVKSGRGEVAINTATKDIAGKWYQGDGLGVNLYLTMSEDHTYTLEWKGCLGMYGTAAGEWTLKDGRVTFLPKSETDMLKEQRLLAATVLRIKAQTVLVAARDEQYFLESGRIWSFQRPEEVQQAYEGEK